MRVKTGVKGKGALATTGVSALSGIVIQSVAAGDYFDGDYFDGDYFEFAPQSLVSPVTRTRRGRTILWLASIWTRLTQWELSPTLRGIRWAEAYALSLLA